MIARVWHGIVPAQDSQSYLEYLNQTGVKDLQNTPGNKGVNVMSRIEGDQAHFILISYWDSLKSIQNFAGEDIQKARYYPQDEDFLIELEPQVEHYEVLV